MILGIETSCDETAAAVARADGAVLAEVVRSQVETHARYGGVVPELAGRRHIETIDQVVREALIRAGIGPRELSAVAVTGGPGLIGALLVGVAYGKALAYALQIPLFPVNHLEGHALTARLTDDTPFPYLLLLVSGGHCQLLVVEGVGRYRRLGATIDDAAGEAFDKAAKLLGLGYPGGPEVERAAAQGSATIALPRPMLGRSEPHFSLAGLKTALRHEALARAPLGAQDFADLCAGFQEAVVEIVADRGSRAPYPRTAQMALRIQAEALKRGVIVYASGGQADGDGDLLMLGPPLAITREQVDEAVTALGDAIAAVTRA